MIKIKIVDLKGKDAGEIKLTAGKKSGSADKLLSQAVRVFLSNQRKDLAWAKTRGQLTSISTAKVYRQKGTGRARHGSKRAPIFVGGGKAHGPSGRQNHKLDLPKKMKQKALLEAFYLLAKEDKVIVFRNLKLLGPKTKNGHEMIKNLLKKAFKEKILLVLAKTEAKHKRAFLNLGNVDLTMVENLNTYKILAHQWLIFSQESFLQFNQKIKNLTN